MSLLLKQLISIYEFEGEDAGIEHTVDMTAYLFRSLYELCEKVGEERMKSYYTNTNCLMFIGSEAIRILDVNLNKSNINLTLDKQLNHEKEHMILGRITGIPIFYDRDIKLNFIDSNKFVFRRVPKYVIENPLQRLLS